MKILEVLEICGLRNNLRGSWLTDEFHLSRNETVTYSDIDLLVYQIPQQQKEANIQYIKQRISRIFPQAVLVSIHSENSLNRLNLEDSKTLATAEFISQYWKIRTIKSFPFDYINAKFTLHLLRQNVEERYSEIAVRIGTKEAWDALYVKTGKKIYFPERYSKKLIMNHGDQKAIEFLTHCILKKPDLEYTKRSIQLLNNCPSLDLWLKNYLVDKINRYLMKQ